MKNIHRDGSHLGVSSCRSIREDSKDLGDPNVFIERWTRLYDTVRPHSASHGRVTRSGGDQAIGLVP